MTENATEQEKWEEMQAYFHSQLMVEIVFTKKDGTERTMICTRKLDIIPKDHHPKEEGPDKKQQNYSVMPVYDLEAKGWRSFSIEALISRKAILREDLIDKSRIN